MPAELLRNVTSFVLSELGSGASAQQGWYPRSATCLIVPVVRDGPCDKF